MQTDEYPTTTAMPLHEEPLRRKMMFDDKARMDCDKDTYSTEDLSDCFYFDDEEESFWGEEEEGCPQVHSAAGVREFIFDCELQFVDDCDQEEDDVEEVDDHAEESQEQEDGTKVDEQQDSWIGFELKPDYITVNALCEPGGACHHLLPEEWTRMKKMILLTYMILREEGEGCFAYNTTTELPMMQIHRELRVEHSSEGLWRIQFQSYADYCSQTEEEEEDWDPVDQWYLNFKEELQRDAEQDNQELPCIEIY